ncbi:hypothetical protein J6590_106867, partial [Homalodisca vitripennis]
RQDIHEIEMSHTQTEQAGVTLLEILTEMKAFRLEVAKSNKNFTDNLNSYSEWVQENSERIKSIDMNLSNITKEIEIIRQENCTLKKNNEQLTKKVVELEQSLRDNTVEIYGVPYNKDEDIITIVSNISKVIGFDFGSEMIDNCYRIKGSAAGPAKPGSIVVKFLRKLDKERFILMRRKKRNVNTRDLGVLSSNS